MSQDRKAMSSSALRRRRQQVKKLRAELKRELAAIEAEMDSRKGDLLFRAHAEVKLRNFGG